MFLSNLDTSSISLSKNNERGLRIKFINIRTCYEEPLEGVSDLVKGKTLMT